MLNNFTIPILSVYARQDKYDPTRTTTLRNAFAKDMDSRFRKLQAACIKKIVVDDCFGLLDKEHQITLLSGEFNFVRSADKVTAFMDWMKLQVIQGLFSVTSKQQLGSSIEQNWSNIYIKDSYQRGVERARYDLGKAGYGLPSMKASGGIEAVMTTPLHMDRAGVVYSRVYSELKGITDAMDKQISQVLTKGIIDGENPRKLAQALVKTISGTGGDLSMTDSLGRFIPARRRAEMLARTEIIRAHHQGQVQEMRNWAVAGVTVKAEWVTAGYNVCPKCAENNGKVYTLDEIEPLIPFHPNCRCAIVPVDMTAKKEKIPETPAVTPAPKEAGADKARIRFQKEEHNIQFQKEKEKAKEFFDGLGVEKLNTLSEKKSPLRDVLRTYFEKEIPHIWHAMEEWQVSTTEAWPMTLKYMATQIEDGCGEMIWKRGLDVRDLFEISEDEYIKFRAIGQAYLATMEIEELLLYRGTDGETGESIVRALTAEGLHRTKWTIEDAPIAGYTSDIVTADHFGRSQDGISVKMLLPKEEIMWHTDLLTGVNNKFWTEHEYLILSGKRQFSIDDILLPNSSSDTISRAKKAPITK